ncbi:ribonucleotide reductase of class Ia (aerobic) alpha subunit [Algibacter lectus]|uniref:Ribonucleotide reductase of class Ia (Aerobic) alpha subunit n=1 Tax=Algibacter lectus TaxID=221126 RepID=A0A090WRG5_9FLAO|nr:ribonucleotide reductase of class Ia (aerobic) alpha subunit [Algibacter lectus]
MNNQTQNQTDTSLNENTKSSNYDDLKKARKEARKEIGKQPEIKWLTENSRQFLSSGYLTDDTTPEVRIREIADRAEEILKIDGFADKFYGYMAEGITL